MNKRLFITISIVSASVLLLVIQLGRFAVDASLHDWYEGFSGYQQAVAEQRTTGKPLALFFYTDWCDSCKKLRNTVLSSNEFSTYKSQLIALKINPEYGAQEKSIADQFGVFSYPTFIILKADSAKPHYVRKTNDITPSEFIQACNVAIQS